ncbi:MAG: tetratricopeptide repeat protein [Kiritimatiellia bacterium]
MRNEIKRVLAVMVLLSAGSALAQVKGRIITTEGRPMPGEIKWSNRDKAYKIKANNIEVSVPPEKVAKLEIPKPDALTDAEALIEKGRGAQAVNKLESVISTYNKLNWDEVATGLLAKAYIADNDAANAIRACEKIIADDPEKAYIGEMAPTYWKALLIGDRLSKLSDYVTKAVKSGDRTASAFALILRGDIIRKEGDSKESAAKALRDGYLRVVVLYKSVKEAQPEALYKAAQCFDELGQSSRADQMRTTLKGEYASSEWAVK